MSKTHFTCTHAGTVSAAGTSRDVFWVSDTTRMWAERRPVAYLHHDGKSLCIGRHWPLESLAGSMIQFVAIEWEAAVTGESWKKWPNSSKFVRVGDRRYKVLITSRRPLGLHGFVIDDRRRRIVVTSRGSKFAVIQRAMLAVDFAWSEWKRRTLRASLAGELREFPEALPAVEMRELAEDIDAAARKLGGA